MCAWTIGLNPPEPWIPIDLAHAALLMGVVASLKPERVVELGFGSGYASDAILQGLEWNQKGRLTIVDNWYDWDKKEPGHVESFRRRGAEFVVSSEEDFVKTAPDGHYDILVSDADHLNAHKWVSEHLRIVRAEGFLFFHDVANQELFPNLACIITAVQDYPHYLFQANSRPGEACHRGWLMVINRRKS